MADRILPVGNGGVLGSSKSMSKMRVNPYRDRAKSFYQRYVMKYHIKKTWGIKLSGETARRVIHQLGYSLVRPRHNNDHLVDEEEKKKQ